MADTFAIVPASGKALWFIGAIVVLLLAGSALVGSMGYSSRATRYDISPSGLSISRTLYGRTLPWASLETDRARVVDLSESPDLQPKVRTNGIGLPGYQAGWFRFRQGGKGLVFMTDRSHLVAVPTREGYTLLLSVSQPDAFVAALRRASEQYQ